MKFRTKVLIINIILLSIAISTVGYFMIKKNFDLALDSQIKSAIEENNLVQSTMEYDLLDISYSSNMITQMVEAFNSSLTGIPQNQTVIYIVYDGELIFSNANNEIAYPDTLWQQTVVGKKVYSIESLNDKYYIYTSSRNDVFNKPLNIITQKDITSIYKLMEQQKDYFRMLLIIVLMVCGVSMTAISFMLTKPLETLKNTSEQFGKGDYDARVTITTSDEIGVLARTYNDMATAVSNHMDELKDMVARREQFVADFTHEMKTPMTSIIGYADTIRSMELPRETQIMAASYIFSEGKRLEAMSMKLFDLIYTGQNKVNFSKINTVKLMSDIMESVTPALSKKNISLVNSCENAIISGDKELLKSAFINIIDNARKASSDNSQIIFTGDIEKEKFVITIQDFGIGISEEHLNRICDEFYMVDKSRSRKEGGAGLGLSLASLIFKTHDADFKISSTLGEGTTMKISFDLYIEEEKEGNYEN